MSPGQPWQTVPSQNIYPQRKLKQGKDLNVFEMPGWRNLTPTVPICNVNGVI